MLSSRDRAKVNAALVLLHDAGVNVAQVTDLAANILATGVSPRRAYERAFNAFVERAPAFHAPLQRVGQLIEATDEQTLARYNVALSSYIETGDASHLRSVEPIARQDMAEMAVRTGDAGFAEGLEEGTAHPAAPTPQEALASAPELQRAGHGPTGYQAARSHRDAPPPEALIGSAD